MKKRMLSTLLALCMALALLPVMALAAPAMAAGTGVTVTGPVYLNSEYGLHLPFSEGRARVAAIGDMYQARYGYIDASGKLVIPMEYGGAESFRDGLAVVGNDNGMGAIDRDGNVVVPFKYFSLSDFQDGFALGQYSIDGEYFLVDKNGKEYTQLEDWMPKAWLNEWREDDTGVVTDILRHELFRLPEGCATMAQIGHQFRDEPIPVLDKNLKIAYFDQYGNNLTGFIFDACHHIFSSIGGYEAMYFQGGVAMVQQKDADGNDKHGYIDLQGNLVVPCVIEEYYVQYANNGLILMMVDEKYGLRDVTGREVLPCTYRQIAFWGDDYIAAIPSPSNGNIIVYDLQGNELGRCPGSGLYTNSTNRGWAGFHEGLCAFISGGKTGFMNTRGEVVIKPQYDFVVHPFNEGVALMMLNGEEGLIDAAGNVVVPFGKYDSIYEFSHGVANVRKGDLPNGKYGLIDTNGNELVPCEYRNLFFFTTLKGNNVVPGACQTEFTGMEINTKTGGEYYTFVLDGYGEGTETPTVTPSQPEQPTTPATNAVLSPQGLRVDGENIECEKYNIDDRNYFKLRDLASLLSGTGSQFEVGYDEATATVSITTGQAYTPIGTELAEGVDNSATTQPSSQTIMIDGEKCDELTVYNIGGSNFFQLRELGNVLGFEVDYDQDTNTAIVNSVEK